MVLALTTLLPQDPHKFHVIINTDNIASQIVLEEGRGKDVMLCAGARQIWLLSALKVFSVSILHKPGSELVLADALSRRFKDGKFEGLILNYTINNSLIEIFPNLSLQLINFKI